MKLMLDGKDIDTSNYGQQTLAGLIRSLEREISPERVIISMTLDGKPLDRQSEADSGDSSLEEIESLEISTQNVTSLAHNTLQTLVDYIPALVGTVDECVLMLTGTDEKKGHLGLGELIEGLQMVSAAWKGISVFADIDGLDPSEVMPDMQQFSDILEQLVQAQENADTVQLCDLLEFEMKPMLESWQSHALELREKM